jgi:hypothetical protein
MRLRNVFFLIRSLMDEWSPTALMENEGLSTQLLPVRRKNEGEPSATPAVSRRSSSIGAWTPLCIVGGTLVTGLTAVLHYMFNAHLENHSVLGYWTQNKSSQVEITLATVFRIVFCFSAGASLCQVVRNIHVSLSATIQFNLPL